MDALLDWVSSNPVATVYVVLGVIAFVFLVYIGAVLDRKIQKLVRRKRPAHRRDRARLYTELQKKKASNACNDRCEGIGIIFRCKHTGGDLQGDHWYPYSLGGATTEKNLVMLCPKCNNKKTNEIPNRLQTWAINHRRKWGRDYSRVYDYKVGQWLPFRYVNEVATMNQDKDRLRITRPGF